MDRAQILSKAMTYCSRTEHCTQDVKSKLDLWGVVQSDMDYYLERLRVDGFLNDARFANAFVRDKFRFGKWGKIKIKYHLRQKGLDDELINRALLEIENDEYDEVLMELMEKKKQSLKESDKLKMKAAMIRYAAAKGYEPDKIYKAIDQILA